MTVNQSNFTDYFSGNQLIWKWKILFSLIQSVKINWFVSEKYFCTDKSVKRQITDSISEDLTDSDLESM